MSTKTVSSRISEESYDKLIETANRQGKPISIFLKDLVENAVNNDKQSKHDEENDEIIVVNDDKEELKEPIKLPEPEKL